MRNEAITRDQAKVMGRFDITKSLVGKLHKDEAVIGGIGHTNWDLWASGRRPQNFYMLGSMGLAVPIAMGVALAQPDRKVFALEGDGSVLMQLGALATVANQAVGNLCIIIMDNGIYQITGGQVTATGQGADIVAIARGAGITQAEWARDEGHFAALMDQALATPGPMLVGVRTDAQKPFGQTERDPPQLRDRFMRGLGVRK